jgi:putative nucleotidyltransferase with HDIG domain
MLKQPAVGDMRHRFATFYVAANIGLGVAVAVWGALNWHSHDPLRSLVFVAAALLASTLKVRLPGVTGTASVLALFVLIGIVNLSLSEAITIGALSMLAQCTWRTKRRPKAVQVAFSVCSFATAIYLTSIVYTYARGRLPEPASLGLLALTFFATNTFPVAGIISLTEGKRVLTVWGGYRWLVPCYAVGASLGWLIGTVPRAIQWELPVLCLPLVYLVHRSSRTHIVQVEQEKKHVVEMNGLHLRTIEALALAIDAKDHTTHDHLQRVQLYAVEIGRDLGLSESGLDALRAAAMLHDIGKLAVPEHIISKPGKLSRAEFERMKIHPVVGAEILERVRFPYPVVPIVYSHHEKWDGSGYPDGLKGNDIPIGARILAAVDCLDALASDRQYRRALPLDEAMAKVAAEAGTSFDPAVVRALQARYRELEACANESRTELPPSLSKDIKIERGSAPAAGFEAEPANAFPSSAGMHPVARARVTAPNEKSCLDMPAAGPCKLSWEEALAVASMRLKLLVPCDALAVYACAEDMLRSKLVTGDHHQLLASLSIPMGEGLVGWVAETGKPILNGNPEVEPGYVRSGGATSALTSAIALPLKDAGRMAGVVALYRSANDAFTADDLVSLLPMCPAIASILAEIEAMASDTCNLAVSIQRENEEALGSVSAGAAA